MTDMGDFESEFEDVPDPSGLIPEVHPDQDHCQHIFELWQHLMHHVGLDIRAAMALGRAPMGMYALPNGVTLTFNVPTSFDIYAHMQYPPEVVAEGMARLQAVIDEANRQDEG